jgi:hypothetical protein
MPTSYLMENVLPEAVTPVLLRADLSWLGRRPPWRRCEETLDESKSEAIAGLSKQLTKDE